MRALTEVELSFIHGADGNDSYNPISLIVGSLSTIAKLPTPVSLAVGIGTEIAIQASPHMPVHVPVPKIPMGPTWNGSGGGRPSPSASLSTPDSSN
ncbi:E492 group microcin [Raoultella terrigena]|uniref:E492 group microcin n=1 Tax=Raoultella terrigena TaxID=577 RepID=UPI001F2E4B44|nr:hypothetical protein [Raoultella terrigena]